MLTTDFENYFIVGKLFVKNMLIFICLYCCEVIYKNSQDLQRISIDLQIYSMSSDLQNKLTRIAANEQRRWWTAKQAAAAGTVTATGGHGSGLSVGGDKNDDADRTS